MIRATSIKYLLMASHDGDIANRLRVPQYKEGKRDLFCTQKFVIPSSSDIRSLVAFVKEIFSYS